MLCRYLIQLTFVTGLLCAILETTHPTPQSPSKGSPSIGQHIDIFQILYNRGQQTCLVKGQIVNTSGFAGHTVVCHNYTSLPL